MAVTADLVQMEVPRVPQRPVTPTNYDRQKEHLRRKTCADCHLPIKLQDDPQEAFGKAYHSKCFVCTRCKNPLTESTGIHEFNHGLYCTTDHTSLASKKICASCGVAIRTRPVEALGQFWHDTHLLCAHCKRPLIKGHVEHESQVYCPEDYHALFQKKCKGCKRPIDEHEKPLSVLGGRWHRSCFVCQHCYFPFTDKAFYVFNNNPYCKNDYHLVTNTLCRACNQEIEGLCVQVQEGRFHPACFICVTCHQELTDDYYALHGKFYCDKDVVSAEQKGQGKAEKRRTVMNRI